jgi:Flp pilus assembly protein TadB
MGGVVPLSEHEQRQLEQIEQALYREDRRLARLVRSSDPRVHYRRRVVQALVGLVLGAGLVAAGIIVHMTWGLVIAGFVIVLLSGIWVLSSWRQMATAELGTTQRGPKAKRHRRRNRGGTPARGTMMERLEERWRRRQEGGF